MSDDALVLRPARESDAVTIARFNHAMARETEHLELDMPRLEAGVRALIADPSKGFYTLAEAGGEIVAQTMITFEWSDWRNANFWWIQSVFVAPGHRRRGIFRALYRHLEERARREACGLRLYVETGNRRAQATYESLGMRKAVYDFYEVDLVLAR